MPNFLLLKDFLNHHFPGQVTDLQMEQFRIAFEGYVEWNEKVNLVSRQDMENLAERHFLHSLSIAKIIHFQDGTSILDAGTGGGFPGIPLAIFFPKVKFLLVDSVRKKLRAAADIAERAGLENVQISVQRLEQMDGQWDFVVSRALADWDKLMPWLKGRIRRGKRNELANGVIYLKGGSVEDERLKMSAFGVNHQIWELKQWFAGEWWDEKLIAWLEPK